MLLHFWSPLPTSSSSHDLHDQRATHATLITTDFEPKGSYAEDNGRLQHNFPSVQRRQLRRSSLSSCTDRLETHDNITNYPQRDSDVWHGHDSLRLSAEFEVADEPYAYLRLDRRVKHMYQQCAGTLTSLGLQV